jgi:hypothetical protein
MVRFTAGIDRSAVHRGFTWEAEKREWVKAGVPVYLPSTDELGREPRFFEIREGVRTVSSGEFLMLKLRTGVRKAHRAQDFADEVNLIEIRGLDESYSSWIAEDVRPELGKIVRKLSDG